MTGHATRPRKAGKPIWPKVSAGFVRSVLAGHSALGLAFAALIYLVCFSGTVAVFVHEFERWENPTTPRLHAIEPEAVQRALVSAQDAFGQPAEHIYMRLPAPESPHFTITADIGHGKVEETWFVDGSGGLAGKDEAAWTRFMTDLHMYLHLPRSWGIFVVGLTGVALLSSLISGVLAHPRMFRDSFHLRWGGSKRLQEADLHNRLGVWGLPFHVLVSLTGSVLGLTTVVVGVLAMVVFQGDMNRVYEMFLGPTPIDDPRAAALPDVASALRNAQRAAPGALPTYIAIEHPNERGQAVLMVVRQPDRLSLGDNLNFDGKGNAIHVPREGEGSLGERILGVLGVLHFGWFGGWPVKVAYGILGAALTTVTSSGVAIWLARRRDKGRPAPHWERIWIAAVWSQPFAFSLSMLIALLTPAVPPLAGWALATITALASAGRWSREQISRRLRLASATLLAVVPGIHGLQNVSASVDPVAWVVDVALVSLAVLVLATVFHTVGLPPKRQV